MDWAIAVRTFWRKQTPPHEARSTGAAKNRSAKRLFLQHTLMISEVMVQLEFACRKTDGVRLITSEEALSQAPEETRGSPFPFQWSVKIPAGNSYTALSIHPDSLFGLEFKIRSNETLTLYFALEADRATMPVVRKGLKQTSFFRKMLAYEESWRRKLHVQKLGVERLRILTVTTSKERVRTLIKANKRLNNGKGSRLFLFTDQVSLAAHDDILTLPLRNGCDDELERLIDC